MQVVYIDHNITIFINAVMHNIAEYVALYHAVLGEKRYMNYA